MIKKQHRDFLGITTFLVRKLPVNTIILFGSAARNDADELSDTDLLLITKTDILKKGGFRVREIYSMIPKSVFPDKRLRLVVYSRDNFDELYERGSLFIAHIISEGEVLYDDGFFETLTKKEFKISKENLKESLEILKQRVALADDLEKYNNIFIRCLAGFFVVSKNIAYIALASKGQLEFNKNRAFAKLESMYPSYKQEIRRLHSLKPFFLRNVRGIEATMPFYPYDCKPRVIELRENVKQLLTKVSEDVN